MGGGNADRAVRQWAIAGLSPRGRGKRARRLQSRPSRRSIPAWAGETSCGGVRHGPVAVYPRVGGGNRRHCVERGYAGGLSPRGRGKLRQRHIWAAPSGSIPAWAGETTTPDGNTYIRSVYPRVGGGNSDLTRLISHAPGLSPRGRGKQVNGRGEMIGTRSIPAWAGETDEDDADPDLHEVYPRVGGGNFIARPTRTIAAGLSPRGRGKR